MNTRSPALRIPPATLERPPAAGRSPTGARPSVRWATALAAPMGYGVLAGLWTPRGPLTTFEALSAMALALAVGLWIGAVARSRWGMVLGPLTFVVVFELVRLPLSGPTVDGIHLDSTYGIMAFAVGRGLHGLLVLLPMAVGVSLGAARSRRLRGARVTPDRGAGLWLRRAVTAVAVLAVVGLAAAVARPSSTDPVVDADGEPLPGSVAELTTVDVGDHDLALMVRGVDVDNAVLLFLAGGPGGSELGAMRRHSESLEQDFVVATLDQRGTGKSYPELDPTETLTLRGAVDDVVAVTDYLRDRFDEQKLYLVGQSWGTTLGVLAVQQRPELFHAYVGVGQMVDQEATDRIFYRDALAWARERGDDGLVRTLEENGPPPYRNVLAYEAALSHEMDVHPYDHSPNSEGAGQMSENLLVEEYTFLEQVHVLGATLDVFSVLYPQLQEVDFRQQAARLEVPVYLAQGRHEAPGRQVLAREWFRMLDAPAKSWTEFSTSGHRPLWEQPEEFHDLMTGVLQDTARSR